VRTQHGSHPRAWFRLVFKGAPDDDVVLCTRDRTFLTRIADTSNTLLLVPLPARDRSDSAVPSDAQEKEKAEEETFIVGVCNAHFELRRMVPLLGRLRTLLEASAYDGNGDGDESGRAAVRGVAVHAMDMLGSVGLIYAEGGCCCSRLLMIYVAKFRPVMPSCARASSGSGRSSGTVRDRRLSVWRYVTRE
jgi:hypothetical protein